MSIKLPCGFQYQAAHSISFNFHHVLASCLDENILNKEYGIYKFPATEVGQSVRYTCFYGNKNNTYHLERKCQLISKSSAENGMPNVTVSSWSKLDLTKCRSYTEIFDNVSKVWCDYFKRRVLNSEYLTFIARLLDVHSEQKMSEDIYCVLTLSKYKMFLKCLLDVYTKTSERHFVFYIINYDELRCFSDVS